MRYSIVLKWITGTCEAFLGIPVIGGLFIISQGYVPLGFMFILHVITLIVCLKEGKTFAGSIVGVGTSMLGVIPVLGMFLHIITACMLLISAYKTQEKAS